MTAVNAPGPSAPTPPSNAPARRMRGRRGACIGLLAVAALIVALLQQSSGHAQQATGDATATPNASPTVAITPEPDARRLILDFTELNDSGVTGTATLYEAGDRTIVDIDVKNTGKDHPAHIHAGTCGQLDPEPAFTLNDVHEDGKSRSVVDAPLEGLINGDFAIDLHLSPTELGTLIDCANIEGEPVAGSAATTPEATGTPAATATTAATATATATSSTTSAGAATETPAPTATATATSAPTETPAPTTAAVGGDGTGGTTQGVGGESTSATSQGVGGETTNTTTTTTTTSGSTSSSTVPAGDGTGSGTSTSSSTTYVSSAGTVRTADLAASGTGPLYMIVETPIDAVIWSVAGFAAILFLSGIWIWRGERRHATHRQSPRWSRLGM
ncbi:MAG TPA: hypothetical protein VNZ55_10795 [Thermomicrobiales bacterium]|nr:hypothetical protein [Thermomicrobiales bacterium]